MFKRLTILTCCLVALSLTLGGCTKCGFWGWDSCRSDAPKPQ